MIGAKESIFLTTYIALNALRILRLVMNDFTKEELINLKECIRFVDHMSKNPSEITNKLNHKIQSMIDRYCEHTWFFYLHNNGSAVKCHKCDKEFPSDNQ